MNVFTVSFDQFTASLQKNKVTDPKLMSIIVYNSKNTSKFVLFIRNKNQIQLKV